MENTINNQIEEITRAREVERYKGKKRFWGGVARSCGYLVGLGIISVLSALGNNVYRNVTGGRITNNCLTGSVNNEREITQRGLGMEFAGIFGMISADKKKRKYRKMIGEDENDN